MLLSLTLCFGCGDSDSETDPTRPSAVNAELSDEISTVVTVTWTTSEPSVGYVEYGPSADELDSVTPIESDAATDHSVQLLGLTPDTEYSYRVVTWDGEDAGRSKTHTLQTGDLPGGLPNLTLEGGGHDRFTLVPILGQTTAVTVLNPEGQVVWYHRDDRELDFYRARLSNDGKSILYNAASVSGDPADDSELVRVALDGSESDSIPVPLLAHDFVEHPDGTLGTIVVEYRDFEGDSLRGDKIVEIAPDGEQTTIWTSWDCFDPAEVPGDDIALGWTFANALDFDAEENAYYLGMRNFSSIAKIDRESGECEWVLGLFGSTIDFASGSDRFLHQHQFELKGDRLLVFDNEGNPGTESRVLEYELDFEANEARQTWSYSSDPPVYTFVLGEPTRLENGDVFIDWSASGQLERVTSDGESLWKLNADIGFAFGFSTVLDSLYPPDATTPP